MTSTEFTIGFGDSVRASSKVLKPPGGGSSDIFGAQPGQSQAASRNIDSTQSRLFGSSEPHSTAVKPDRMKSSIFGDVPANSPAKSTAKKFVSRNPITGEVIEIKSANGDEDNKTDGTVAEDGATNGTDTNDIGNDNTETNSGTEKTSTDPVTGNGLEASRPVQTCIRIKNPPGGKSSGIF